MNASEAATCFLIWALIGFTACSVNRALPKEKTLFPDAGTEKWWIINTISKDENNKDIHICALIRFIPAYGKYFTHFFTSLWSESDNTYYSGSQSSDEPYDQKRFKFPIRLAIPAKDSVSFKWSWKLDRKSMRLQAVVRDEKNNASLPLIMKIRLRNDSSFNLVETRTETITQNLAPAIFDTKLSGAWHIKSPAVLNLHVIDSGEKLLAKTKHSFVSWLDLSLDQGDYFSLLYETNLQGDIRLLSQIYWEKEQVSDTTSLFLRAEMDEIVKDSFKKAPYPLHLTLAIPEKNITLFIKPRMESQEIKVNKNSFWMGAVQAKDSITGAIVGNGNLYVLKQ